MLRPSPSPQNRIVIGGEQIRSFDVSTVSSSPKRMADNRPMPPCPLAWVAPASFCLRRCRRADSEIDITEVFKGHSFASIPDLNRVQPLIMRVQSLLIGVSVGRPIQCRQALFTPTAFVLFHLPANKRCHFVERPSGLSELPDCLPIVGVCKPRPNVDFDLGRPSIHRVLDQLVERHLISADEFPFPTPAGFLLRMKSSSSPSQSEQIRQPSSSSSGPSSPNTCARVRFSRRSRLRASRSSCSRLIAAMRSGCSYLHQGSPRLLQVNVLPLGS